MKTFKSNKLKGLGPRQDDDSESSVADDDTKMLGDDYFN